MAGGGPAPSKPGGILGAIGDVIGDVVDTAGDVAHTVSHAASDAASAVSSVAGSSYTAAGGSPPAPRPAPFTSLPSLVSLASPLSNPLGSLGDLLRPPTQPGPAPPPPKPPERSHLALADQILHGSADNPATAILSTSGPARAPADPRDPLGPKTVGDVPMSELIRNAGGLQLNDRGRITTPRIRRGLQELRAPLPGLDPGQTRVANIVLGEGLDAHASPSDLLAGAETGLVESNLRNLGYGDADSQGWRQERTSIYGTGPTGPRNVRASADRFWEELASDAGTSTAATPGLKAQAAQGSAYPERYDEQEGVARPIVDAFLTRSRRADHLGLPMPGDDGHAGSLGGLRQLKGPYDGSRRFVSSLVGQPVWGDKELGHSPSGMHQPVSAGGLPNAYAQDINMPGGNPAEGEPAYDQQTVSEIVRNLRHRGAQIPAGFQLGENWEGNVDGYDVEFLTAPHGSGPHIHIGAEWLGEEPPAGTYSGEPSGGGGLGGGYAAPGLPGVGGAVPAATGLGGEVAAPMTTLTQLASPLAAGPTMPADLLMPADQLGHAESAADTILSLLGEEDLLRPTRRPTL